MTVQDQSGDGARLSEILARRNELSLGATLQFPSLTAIQQLKEQFACGSEFSPKVRKPYTITKQRERWTEEEHTKFLEALKLYGRAWRRTEEHIGTKTAVQIRSHAQKFFSKVVKESSGSGSGAVSVEVIEIPPPRPKRKPVHPYPRKLMYSSYHQDDDDEDKELQNQTSASSTASEQEENLSPTSVLSGKGFDAPGCSSISPVSSPHDSQHLLSAEETVQVSAELGSPPTTDSLVFNIELAQKLELLPESRTQSWEFKLFGRTVVVSTDDDAEMSDEGETSPWLTLSKPLSQKDDSFSAEKDNSEESLDAMSSCGETETELVEEETHHQQEVIRPVRGFMPYNKELHYYNRGGV